MHPGAQVYPESLPGAVYLLWLRQRFPECRPHAFFYSALDFTERQYGVRVHVVYLVPFVLCDGVILLLRTRRIYVSVEADNMFAATVSACMDLKRHGV